MHTGHMTTALRLADKVTAWFLPLLAVAAFVTALGMSQEPTLDDLIGECSYEMRGVVGSPCWSAGDPTSQAAEKMAAADELAAVTEGLDCWDPSTGRVGAQIVVRDTATSEVSVIPFTVEAYERAVAGEFTTLKACA